MLHKLFCALISSDSVYDKCMHCMVSVFTCDAARNVYIQFRAGLTVWCGWRTDARLCFIFTFAFL